MKRPPGLNMIELLTGNPAQAGDTTPLSFADMTNEQIITPNPNNAVIIPMTPETMAIPLFTGDILILI